MEACGSPYGAERRCWRWGRGRHRLVDMGMFDRFRPEPHMVCPNCGDSHIDELQTKAFPNAYLRDIRLGDPLPDQDELQIIEGRVEGITHCGEPCSSANPKLVWLRGFAVIRSARWMGEIEWVAGPTAEAAASKAVQV